MKMRFNFERQYDYYRETYQCLNLDSIISAHRLFHRHYRQKLQLLPPTNQNIAEFLSDFVSLYGEKRWGVSMYDSQNSLIANYINPIIGDMKVQDITTRVVDKYIQTLQKTPAVNTRTHHAKTEFVTNATIEKIIKLLRCAFKQAVRWELVAKNPFDNVVLPKVEYKKRDIWTADMIRTALDQCTDSKLYVAMNLAFACSLRMGEILGLTWSNVHISDEDIADDNAYVYIDKELARASKRAIEMLGQKDIYHVFTPLFPNTSTRIILKKPKTDSSIRKVWLPKTLAYILREWKSAQDELRALLRDEYNGGKIQEVYYRENNEPLALENTFEYDKLGQLTSATGAFGNETYTYDTAGNLLTRTSGATSAQYTYDNPSWGDLLTAYQGQRIAYEGQSYDAENNTVTGTVVSGNPVSYYNGNRWDMEWIRGRLLSQATSDDISVAYTYDKNNLRSSKTVNGVEYSYTYAGDKLMRQSWAGNELYFFYDASGNPTALWYEPENGSTVVGYYMLDQQGDVVRMEDANGNVLASYSYDPWGKIISATGSLAEINPLRYRGYVYDQETGFYYLQSRYYDPAISRFLNADGYAVTGEGDVLGYNMFAYCNNDPVNKSDTDGSRPVEVDEDPNRRLVATLRSELRGDTTSIDTKNPPPEGSGYQPPKKGLNKSHNRGKVRNPNGQGQGWPDKDGNVWVPDNGMDGGPGWVVQHPDGGHHHVYPDGKTRYHSSQMVITGVL